VPVNRGFEQPAGLASMSAPEDDFGVFGAADVEVIGDEGFEEGTGMPWGIEDDGGGDLDLRSPAPGGRRDRDASPQHCDQGP
jgi:hypothetical protein